jgi:hypothetical protein
VTVKLAWQVVAGMYRLRIFAGRSSQTRKLAGELVLEPAIAYELREVLLAGEAARGVELFSEAGWIAPAPSSSSGGGRV